MKKLAIALLAVVAAGVVPAGADHGAACRDDYFCETQGSAINADATFTNGDEIITVTTSLRREERLSSEGHTSTWVPSVQIDRRIPGGLGAVCIAPAASITYDASDVIHVISTAEGCSLDLTWTNTGTPSASVDRRVDVTPGIPTQFTSIYAASAGPTISSTAEVTGTINDAAVATSDGKTKRHEYVGHVTLIR